MNVIIKKRTLSKKLNKAFLTMMLILTAIMFLLPLILTFTNSFMREQEIQANYAMGTRNAADTEETIMSREFVNLKLIPDIVTLKQYYAVLIGRTQFLVMFWNSVKIVLPILVMQLLIASMAAYAFAKIEFKLRDKLFLIYILVMLMPFQVTLVPNYIIADRLGIMGTYLSIILPGIFNTFGVFLLKQFMQYIPDAYLESAVMDGAGHLYIFSRIVLPMSKAGIAALAILVFIDNWNMVEQPLIFLQDVNIQPLSVYLSAINGSERGLAFAASVLYMLPMLLAFLYGENYLVEGIQLSGLKG